MGYEIEAEDNYNLIQLTESFETADLYDLVSRLNDGLLDTPYVIVQSAVETEFGKEILGQFSEINNVVLEQNGLMLFVDFQESDLKEMDQLGLTHIPSLDEAIDYAFIDRLEKEMEDE